MSPNFHGIKCAEYIPESYLGARDTPKAIRLQRTFRLGVRKLKGTQCPVGILTKNSG